LCMCLFNYDSLSYSDEHKKLLDDYRNNVKYARIGYLPCMIIHHFHGNKKTEDMIPVMIACFVINLIQKLCYAKIVRG